MSHSYSFTFLYCIILIFESAPPKQKSVEVLAFDIHRIAFGRELTTHRTFPLVQSKILSSLAPAPAAIIESYLWLNWVEYKKGAGDFLSNPSVYLDVGSWFSSSPGSSFFSSSIFSFDTSDAFGPSHLISLNFLLTLMSQSSRTSSCL